MTASHQASLPFTISWSLLKFMSSVLVMPSNHLIFYHPLLLPSIFPSIRVFSNESTLHIRWPKYWSWSFSFSISPSNEYSGLISFRIDWFGLLELCKPLCRDKAVIQEGVYCLIKAKRRHGSMFSKLRWITGGHAFSAESELPHILCKTHSKKDTPGERCPWVMVAPGNIRLQSRDAEREEDWHASHLSRLACIPLWLDQTLLVLGSTCAWALPRRHASEKGSSICWGWTQRWGWAAQVQVLDDPQQQQPSSSRTTKVHPFIWEGTVLVDPCPRLSQRQYPPC